MLRLTTLLLVLASATAAVAGINGNSIAINFASDEPAGAAEGVVNGAAGVAGTVNWNNLIGAAGFAGDDVLSIDNGGVAAPDSNVTIEWVSNNTWASDGRGEDINDAPDANDRALMLGYLDTTDTSVTEIIIEGIPDNIASGYDVYLYMHGGVIGRGGTYTVNDGTNELSQDNVTTNIFDGSYVAGETGNYLLFSGLSGNSLNIQGTPTTTDLFRAPINGVEICAIGACTVLPNAVASRGNIGNQLVSGTREGLVFSEPGDPVPGLGQSWYNIQNPGSKEAFDSATNGVTPDVPYFQGEEGSWWSGSQAVLDVPQYPLEVADVITGDNYSVKLEGEILIPESGTIQFLDGVDDFTYFAVDLDRSGVAGDDATEVLINDNSWTNALSSADANGGAPIVAVEFTDIEAGGEWLAMEFNMGEGGGGDHGMLYWDALDEDEVFPIAQGDGVFEEDAIFLLIPDSNLRSPSTPAELISGELNATAPVSETGWEFELNSDGTSDAFVLENPQPGVLNATLDVDGLEIYLAPEGNVSEGDSWQIFVADNVTGTPNIVTEGWSYDATTGSVVFGTIPTTCDPNTMGDLDGNGTVEFADFLILSGNFGNAVEGHEQGDIDCNGTVEFADFLVLSGNFGTEVGAASVPEPAAFTLLGCCFALLGTLRRRR